MRLRGHNALASQTWAGRSAELDAYREDLRRYLRTVIDEFRVPGVVVEILAMGHRVGATAGDIIAEVIRMPSAARFEIGSVYRFLSSLVVLELVSQKKLALDTPVGTYLSELRNSRFGQEVLLWQVLCDSCGYRAARGNDEEILRDYSRERFIQSLRAAEPLFKPGTVTSQTLESPALLAAIAQEEAGQPLPTLVCQMFERLNIDPPVAAGRSATNAALSYALDSRTNRPRPMARASIHEFWRCAFPDWKLSAADLMAVVDAVLTAREGLVSTPIGQQLALDLQRQFFQTQFASQALIREELPTSVGPGCHGFGPEWLGINGSGSRQSLHLRYHTAHKVAIVIGANMSAPSMCNRITADISRSLGIYVKSPDTPGTNASFPERKELIGTYRGISGADLRVRAAGTGALCEMSWPRPISILLTADCRHSWAAAQDAGWAINFFHDEDGVPSLMLDRVAYKKVCSG